MKFTVELSQTEIEFLDRYAERHSTSRSAALADAVCILREKDLGEAYADAWFEWDDSTAKLWDSASADGF